MDGHRTKSAKMQQSDFYAKILINLYPARTHPNDIRIMKMERVNGNWSHVIRKPLLTIKLLNVLSNGLPSSRGIGIAWEMWIF